MRGRVQAASRFGGAAAAGADGEAHEDLDAAGAIILECAALEHDARQEADVDARANAPL